MSQQGGSPQEKEGKKVAKFYKAEFDGKIIVRSSTKSAVQEAAEAAAAAGWTGRKSEERSAARIAFMEHLKNMQAYADKKGVTPKHWNMYSAVHTGEEAHEIGRPDGLC